MVVNQVHSDLESESQKKPKIADEYLRYSSYLQDEKTLLIQQSEMDSYATQHDLKVRNRYIDAAKSGTTTVGRDAYYQMITTAHDKKNKPDVILMYSSSRGGRSYEDLVDDYMLRNKLGIEVIWVSQPGTEGDSPETDMIRMIIKSIDIYYSKLLSRVTHDYQRYNAQDGFKNGGKIPDGYNRKEIPTGRRGRDGKERIKVKMQLNKDQGRFDLTDRPRWQWIRRAANLALKSGLGLKTIVQKLFSEGWRQARQDLPLGPTHVREALTNPVYTGYLVWNRKKWFRNGKNRQYKVNPLDKWIWSKDPSHPAVYTKEEYETLSKRFNLVPRGTRVGRQLTSGLAVCNAVLKSGQICGSNLILNSTRKKRNKTYAYLFCNRKHRFGWKSCPGRPISSNYLNRTVEQVFLQRILTDVEIKKFVEAFNKWLAQGMRVHGPRIKEIKSEISKLDRELSNFRSAIAVSENNQKAGKYLMDDIIQREEQKERLVGEMKRLEEPINQQRLAFRPSDTQRWIDTLKKLYSGMELEAKRVMLRHYIKRIEVNPDKTGRIIYDPAATMTFRSSRGFPQEDLFRLSNGCGGRI